MLDRFTRAALLHRFTSSFVALVTATAILAAPANAQPATTCLVFDGYTNYIEVSDSADFSGATTGR